MKLITSNELSELLRISKTTVAAYRKRGMPYIRLDKKLIRYDFQSVEQWLKNQTKGENYEITRTR